MLWSSGPRLWPVERSVINDPSPGVLDFRKSQTEPKAGRDWHTKSSTSSKAVGGLTCLLMETTSPRELVNTVNL